MWSSSRTEEENAAHRNFRWYSLDGLREIVAVGITVVDHQNLGEEGRVGLGLTAAAAVKINLWKSFIIIHYYSLLFIRVLNHCTSFAARRDLYLAAESQNWNRGRPLHITWVYPNADKEENLL